MLRKTKRVWRRLPEKHRRTGEITYESQVLYQQVFESGPDAKILVDEGGRIVAANYMAEAVFGYRRETMIGQMVEMLLPESQREGHQEKHRQYVARLSGQSTTPAVPIPEGEAAHRRPGVVLQPTNLELPALHSDGSIFPADITLNPVNTSSGLKVLCVIRNIALRKAREKALQEQSDLVRLLQDVAIASNEADSIEDALQFSVNRLTQYLNWPIGHALLVRDDPLLSATDIWNKDLHESYASFRKASELMHFSSGSGLPGIVLNSGQPMWITNLSDHPQFLRREEARQAGLRTGLAIPVLTGQEVVGVLEFFHNQLITPNPNLMAVLPHIGVQIGRVIERRRAEDALRKSAARLRMVMNNLPVFLWVIDRQGKLIMIEGRGITGLNINPNEMLGRSVFDLSEQRPELTDLLQRSLAGETIHTELTEPSGAVFESYFTPYYDSNWAVDGVIGLSFDITERKKMEADLDEMRHRMLESVESERARLGQHLHDGPLQDLYGAYYEIQELVDKVGPNELEQAHHALSTLQQVAGTLRMICGELHPSTLVHLGLQKSIRSHADRLQERMDGIEIHLDLARDESPRSRTVMPPSSQGQVLSSALRLALFRIYQQLIDNATRHAQARNIWVRLRLPDGLAVLEVQDNGRGFGLPNNWIALVRQGRLGLVSVLERAESLNGKMEIETSPNQGTLVRVIVPRE